MAFLPGSEKSAAEEIVRGNIFARAPVPPTRGVAATRIISAPVPSPPSAELAQPSALGCWPVVELCCRRRYAAALLAQDRRRRIQAAIATL